MEHPQYVICRETSEGKVYIESFGYPQATVTEKWLAWRTKDLAEAYYMAQRLNQRSNWKVELY